MAGYVELQTTTNFSFLRGASHPQELVGAAYDAGHPAIGITDRNSMAGVVRAWTHANHLAKQLGIHPPRVLVGARLVFSCGAPDVLCYPTNRTAYGRLTRLLSTGQLRSPKGECDLRYPDLREFGDGQIVMVVPPPTLDAAFKAALARVSGDFSGRAYLAAARSYAARDARRLHRLAALAREHATPMTAVNDVLYHEPERRPLQDVLTCIREKTMIAKAGLRLEANAERHLKPAHEMARLFEAHPQAIARTLEIATRIHFDLSHVKYEYPDEPVPSGYTPIGRLKELTWRGAHWRYPAGVPRPIRRTINKELRFIEERSLSKYFLTVHDFVRFAREEAGILCQGRGSAANSAVCFCLGITAVNPADHKVLFERFLSANRDEPPDIDVDFEHERREEVMQYVYRRYGREKAAICATVIHYRPRSAVRDVGKAMGLTEDVTAALADTVWGSWGDDLPDEHVLQAGFDPGNPEVRRAVALANQLLKFPRHLSQHVGGFVLTQHRLDETVPIGNGAMKDRTFIEWDKDDIDALGLMKVDVLALGMLTTLKRGFDLLNAAKGGIEGRPVHDIAELPNEDPAVYAMLSRADSVGVFQVESRAQMSMLPRLKPAKFYDLVIEVAIVRPGPIQGNMVHPYLRRREGNEQVTYPSPAREHGPSNELEEVLGSTLGVPLFQEQAMRLAIVAAKFTSEEADGLRRSMATFKHTGGVGEYHAKFVERMVARGYQRDFAENCFAQIEGFGSYGFPESHAASFAKLVYASAWLKCRHPDVFCAAILNSQPMGFYQPAQLVRDAREHGVEVRGPDVLNSDWDCTLEPGEGPWLAVRLGFRQIKGLPEAELQRLVAARAAGARTFEDLMARARLSQGAWDRLAEADAFRSLGLDRRAALWAVKGADAGKGDLLDGAAPAGEPIQLPLMPLPEHVAEDYRTVSLSLKAHPVSFFRPALAAAGAVPARDLKLTRWRSGRRVAVAGLVLIRQRPGTAKGVTFITLEDETGAANLVIWQDRFQANRKTWMTASFILVRGQLQKANGVIHLVAETVEDWSPRLSDLRSGVGEPPRMQTEVQGRLLRSRDFH
ncbi:MAG: error-prone DNA polymerase [Proteobacteria bacterium]|nr:error-prone DNA polymerase [Pseudomonadota bacterium]